MPTKTNSTTKKDSGEEMSQYDRLIEQVESLKLENSSLKKELCNNSTQISKLESEALSLKKMVMKLGNSINPYGNMDFTGNSSSFSPVFQQFNNSNNQPHYSSNQPQHPNNNLHLSNNQNNRPVNGNLKQNGFSNNYPQTFLNFIPSPSTTISLEIIKQINTLKFKRSSIMKSLKQDEVRKDKFMRQLKDLQSRLDDFIGKDKQFSPTSDMSRHQVEQHIYDITEAMEKDLGTPEIMESRVQEWLHQIQVIDFQIKKFTHHLILLEQPTFKFNNIENVEHPFLKEGIYFMNTSTQTQNSTSSLTETNNIKISIDIHSGLTCSRTSQTNFTSMAQVSNKNNSEIHSNHSSDVLSNKEMCGSSTSFSSLPTKILTHSSKCDVHELRSMLGSNDRDDMSHIFLNLSLSYESSLALKQGGFLPLLLQLLHDGNILPPHLKPSQSQSSHQINQSKLSSKEVAREKDQIQSKNGIKERASKSLRNIVTHIHPNPEGVELRVLSLLEVIRGHCSLLYACLNKSGKGYGEVKSNENLIQCLNEIMHLSYYPNEREAINELGGLFCVAEFLILDAYCAREFHVEEDNSLILLRKFAGLTLTNLTFADSINKTLLIHLEGLLDAVKSYLNSVSEEVKQAMASILRNLSWQADNKGRELLKQTGVVRILTLSLLKVKKEGTLKSMLSALWNLSGHCVENRETICNVEGSLAFLVCTLSYKSQSKSSHVVESGGGILRNLSNIIAKNQEYRKILRKHDCLEILIQHLTSASLTIVSNACGTLWNLSNGNAEDQQMLWELGAVGKLRKLINSKHEVISKGSSATLKHLMGNRPNKINDIISNPSNSGLPTLQVRKQKQLESSIKFVTSQANEDFSPHQHASVIIDQRQSSQNHKNYQPAGYSGSLRNITSQAWVDPQLTPSTTLPKTTGLKFVDKGGKMTFSPWVRESNKATDIARKLEQIEDYADNDEVPVNYCLQYQDDTAGGQSGVKIFNEQKPNKSGLKVRLQTPSEAVPVDSTAEQRKQHADNVDFNAVEMPTNFGAIYHEEEISGVVTSTSLGMQPYNEVVQPTIQPYSKVVQPNDVDVYKKYDVENTPICFSGNSSLSDPCDNQVKENDENKSEQGDKFPLNFPDYEYCKSNRPSGIATPKTPYYGETPMVFSRHSPVSSVNTDDCSSVCSDVSSQGSRLQSGVISDGDLPESPGQSMPTSRGCSPKNRKPSFIDNCVRRDVTKPKPYRDVATEPGVSTKVEVSERAIVQAGYITSLPTNDEINHYVDEGTFSPMSPLSGISLIKEGDCQYGDTNVPRRCHNSNSYASRSSATGESIPASKRLTKKEVTPSVQKADSLSDSSSSSDDDDLLAECIEFAVKLGEKKSSSKSSSKSRKLLKDKNSSNKNEASLLKYNPKVEEKFKGLESETTTDTSMVKSNRTQACRQVINEVETLTESYSVKKQMNLVKRSQSDQHLQVTSTSAVKVQAFLLSRPATFNTEGTPIEMSRSTSLSNITMDSGSDFDFSALHKRIGDRKLPSNLLFTNKAGDCDVTQQSGTEDSKKILNNIEEQLQNLTLNTASDLALKIGYVTSMPDCDEIRKFNNEGSICGQTTFSALTIDSKTRIAPCFPKTHQMIKKPEDNLTSLLSNNPRSINQFSSKNNPQYSLNNEQCLSNNVPYPVQQKFLDEVVVQEEPIKDDSETQTRHYGEDFKNPIKDHQISFNLVEDTPGFLSGDSLSSLDIDSDGDDDLLKDCISSAMPVARRDQTAPIPPIQLVENSDLITPNHVTPEGIIDWVKMGEQAEVAISRIPDLSHSLGGSMSSDMGSMVLGGDAKTIMKQQNKPKILKEPIKGGRKVKVKEVYRGKESCSTASSGTKQMRNKSGSSKSPCSKCNSRLPLSSSMGKLAEKRNKQNMEARKPIRSQSAHSGSSVTQIYPPLKRINSIIFNGVVQMAERGDHIFTEGRIKERTFIQDQPSLTLLQNPVHSSGKKKGKISWKGFKKLLSPSEDNKTLTSSPGKTLTPSSGRKKMPKKTKQVNVVVHDQPKAKKSTPKVTTKPHAMPSRHATKLHTTSRLSSSPVSSLSLSSSNGSDRSSPSVRSSVGTWRRTPPRGSICSESKRTSGQNARSLSEKENFKRQNVVEVISPEPHRVAISAQTTHRVIRGAQTHHRVVQQVAPFNYKPKKKMEPSDTESTKQTTV